METVTLKEISQRLTGRTSPWQEPIAIQSVSTDSRAIEPGCLFIALEGERFDGHDYIDMAFAKGAAAVVARQKRAYSREEVLYVEDTQRALMELGGLYRDKFNLHMVGVTGSVGKTTTKDMIACVLSSQYETLKTPGNWNNEIGLPKTLLQLTPRHQAAVIEMGMTHAGEIVHLARITRPQAAVITSIGVSHIENLGSRTNILRAKLEITEGLSKGGALILNVDNDLLQTVRSRDFTVIGYAIENEDAQVRAVSLNERDSGTAFTICWQGGEYPAWIPCRGEHNVLDALAAFAVGVQFGITPQQAAKALSAYEPSGMRQNIVEHGGFTVVEDCYNASPDSMAAALRTLASMECRAKRIAVLGDMLELGDFSRQAHCQIGELAAESGVDLLLGYGPDSAAMVQAAQAAGCKAIHFEGKEELFQELCRQLAPGDIVWVKASRGMKLEEIIERLYKER